MNVIEDENGNVTGADKNDVTIKGNIGVTTGAVNVSDIHGTKSEINLGLTTDKSSLTGVVQNSFGDGVAQGMQPLPVLQTCGCKMVQPGIT